LGFRRRASAVGTRIVRRAIEGSYEEPDLEAIEALEQYLRSAPILAIAQPPVAGGAHPGKQTLLLTGGIRVIAKPGIDPTDTTEPAMRREAAAWEVAKALGFSGLIATTVIRRIPHPDRTADDVEASVQVHWPDAHLFCAPVNAFPEEDIWQAAIFDAVVAHQDHNGTNWLAVPAPGRPEQPRLKLIDNAYAFEHPSGGPAPNSSFYELCKGQELPDYAVEGLEALVDKWPLEALERLVEEGARNRVCERAQMLLQRRVLEV
jgi:hypothetical protein